MNTKQTTLQDWRIAMGQDINQSHNKSKVNKIMIQNNQEVTISKNLVQQQIPNISTEFSETYWGHQMPPKIEGIIRLGLRNVNSLPIQKVHSKNEQFIRDVFEGNFDIFCCTETNVAWHNITGQDTASERFRGRFEMAKIVTANNRDKG
jgi:hypothetical protein